MLRRKSVYRVPEDYKKYFDVEVITTYTKYVNENGITFPRYTVTKHEYEPCGDRWVADVGAETIDKLNLRNYWCVKDADWML